MHPSLLLKDSSVSAKASVSPEKEMAANWKVVAERLDAGFLASGGDEFNPGPETGWIAQSFCVIKFY